MLHQSAPGRGGAVGKRSRMRPGLPEFYNNALLRPEQDVCGFDIIYVDVRLWCSWLERPCTSPLR